MHIWLSFTIHYFIFHFKCYSILHFAVCQLLCWAFLFTGKCKVTTSLKNSRMVTALPTDWTQNQIETATAVQLASTNSSVQADAHQVLAERNLLVFTKAVEQIIAAVNSIEETLWFCWIDWIKKSGLVSFMLKSHNNIEQIMWSHN